MTEDIPYEVVLSTSDPHKVIRRISFTFTFLVVAALFTLAIATAPVKMSTDGPYYKPPTKTISATDWQNYVDPLNGTVLRCYNTDQSFAGNDICYVLTPGTTVP